MPEALIGTLVALVVLGLIAWVITQIPMDAAVKQIIHVVVVVAAVLILIYFLLGLVGSMGSIGYWPAPHHGGYYR